MSSRDSFDDFDERFDDRRDPVRETSGPGPWIPFVVAGAAVVVAAAVYVLFAPERDGFVAPDVSEEFADGAAPRGGVDEEKAEGLRRAFAEGNPDRLPGVPALFDDLRDAAGREDPDAAFRALVDFDRLVGEVRTVPGELERSPFFWASLKVQLQQSVYLPAAFDECRIVDVEPYPGGRALVHAVSWQHRSDIVQETRWWLSEGNGGRWRFYDWELVQRGVRESLLESIHQRSLQSEVDAYNRLIDGMNDAYAAAEWEGFQAEMERAKRVVPTTSPELRDRLWFDLARMYFEYDDHENVLDTLDEVSDPDGVPGAHLLRAHALATLGRREPALAAITVYARHVPGSPNVDRITGDVLFALGRREEALPYLGRAFQFAPDQSVRLDQYLEAVPVGEEQRVVELLRSLEDAADVAFRLQVWDDRAPVVIEALGEFLTEIEPDTERGRLRIAEARGRQGYKLAAARRYEAVAKATMEPAIAQQARIGRLVALRDAGRVEEAYDTAEDKVEAFAALAEFSTEDGAVLDDEELEVLVKRHVAAHPDDPRGRLVEAWLAGQNGDHAAAIAAARKGFEHVVRDEEDDDWTDAELEEVLYEARLDSGAWRAAYLDHEDPATGFANVARGLRWRERFDDLRKLLELHPHDADNFVDRLEFEGYLAVHDETYARADQLFARAQDRVVEEWRRNTFRRERARLRAEGHLPWDDSEQLGPPDDVLRDLGHAFQTAQRWDHLKTLLDAYERRSGRTPLWLTMRIALAQHDEDPEAIASVLLETPPSRWGDPDAKWQRVGLLGDLVDAMIRLDRADEMLRWWDTHEEDLPDDAFFPRLQLLVTAGRVDDVVRFAEEHDVGEYVWTRLGNHETTGPILRSPPFEAVRSLGTMLPPGFDEYAVLLVKSPPNLDRDRIESAVLAALDDEAEIAPLASSRDDVDGCLVTTPNGTGWISLHRTPFEKGLELYSDERPELVDELDSHVGRIGIGLVDDGQLEQSDVHRIAAELMDAKLELAGVYLQYPNMALPANDDVRELLKQGATERERVTEAGGVPGWYGNWDESTDYTEQTRLTTSLRVVRLGLARPPEERPGKFRLVLRVGPAGFEETWRLAVESTDARDFRCRLLTESQLVPSMRPGTILRPRTWTLHDWELLDAAGNVLRNGRSEIDPEADGPRGL